MSIRFCGSCGMRFDESQGPVGRFCPNCGAATEQVQQAAPAQEPLNTEPGFTPEPQQIPSYNPYDAQQAPVTGQPYSSQTYPPQPYPGYSQPEQTAPKKNNTAVIIAVVAAAVIVLGVILFFILKPRYIENITLEENSITVDINDSYDIGYTVEPGNYKGDELTWTTSDRSVATVENGTITPVGEGTCTITVSSKNTSGEIEVEVQILPQDITFPSLPADINVGDTVDLDVKITPDDVTDDTITWSSSDESIATVSDGAVTGVSIGTCTITATTVNGLEATCNVTVIKPKYVELVVGTFREVKIYDTESDKTVTPGSNPIMYTINEDGTAYAYMDGEDNVNFTWEFLKVDEDGNYVYVFTNENGGEFYAYIMEQTDHPEYIGQFWFVISDGVIECERT